MSDLFVALPPLTSHDCVLFAKNSDRPPSEVQEVIYCPSADHDPGSKVKCTFVEVDQVPHTHEVILSKPAWSWGAEMGANGQGLTGGTAAVWTTLCHPGDHEEKLLGVDLVRLALERCSAARDAVDVVTSLLTKHGQGGACCEDPSYGQWTYHSSFMFADRTEAWMLETAGTVWAAKKITGGVCAMSSTLTIGTDYDLSSPGLKETAESSGHWKAENGEVDFAKAFNATFEGLSLSEKQQPTNRLQCGTELLQSKAKAGKITVNDMFDILRDKDSCINFCGELLTVGSQVSAVQPPGSKVPDIHWFTATPVPDLSVFKPFIFCKHPDVGIATISPTISTEIKARSGSQTCADRRHLLYRMHEQGRELMESGSPQGKKLREIMASLEKQCVKDIFDFLESFDESLMEEVPELFKDITESEAKFYK